MRRRINFARPIRRFRSRILACSAWAVLAAGVSPAPACAQQKASSLIIDSESAATEKTVLLFVLQHDAKSPVAKEDMDSRMLATLHDAMLQTGRFQIVTYSPDHPVVKRALHEHTLATVDLIEPISQETLHTIAGLLGARDILTLGVHRDKQDLVTEFSLQHSTGLRAWATVSSDRLRTATEIGRRRLKPNELASIAVDALMGEMKLPSHLSDQLHLTKAPRAVRKSPHPSEDPPTVDTVPSVPVRPPPVSEAHVTKTPIAPAPSLPPSALTQEHGADTQDPSTPPPPEVRRQDNEAQALQYLQSGDQANYIVSLRRAINDHPHEMNLRRQLIQAYQDRKMSEAAKSEVLRGIEIAPMDAGMHRLLGATLMAQGDITGALDAYRTAIRLAPGDVIAQVEMGDALVKNSQFPEAQEAYTVAVKGAPGSPLPHIGLAHVFILGAAADGSKYTAAIAEIQQAKALIASTDTQTYSGAYVVVMHTMSHRFRAILEEVQFAYQDSALGKRSHNALMRTAADLKDRAEAAADFLDKLPPPFKPDVTGAHYQQGSALLLQAISTLHDLLTKENNPSDDKLKDALVDAEHEFALADKRLATPRLTTP